MCVWLIRQTSQSIYLTPSPSLRPKHTLRPLCALSSQMWAIIKNNDLASMRALIDAAPTVVHARSSDGRGPLWWAYEFKREGMKQLLMKRGCDAQVSIFCMRDVASMSSPPRPPTLHPTQEFLCC